MFHVRINILLSYQSKHKTKLFIQQSNNTAAVKEPARLNEKESFGTATVFTDHFPRKNRYVYTIPIRQDNQLHSTKFAFVYQ